MAVSGKGTQYKILLMQIHPIFWPSSSKTNDFLEFYKYILKLEKFSSKMLASNYSWQIQVNVEKLLYVTKDDETKKTH